LPTAEFAHKKSLAAGSQSTPTRTAPNCRIRKVQRYRRFALDTERNLVEHFFNFIKHSRGVDMRDEKTARNFLAGLLLVCALAWLK